MQELCAQRFACVLKFNIVAKKSSVFARRSKTFLDIFFFGGGGG